MPPPICDTVSIVKYLHVDSPVGPLTIVSGSHGLKSILFGHHRPDGGVEDSQANEEAAAQLQEYFSGERQDFDLPLAPEGTAFQRSVWDQLGRIRFGKTLSYGALARNLGMPGGARAVGMANNRNPIPIIIPCHRVIGANGALTGYAGGLDVKAQLLTLEGALPTKEHAATSHARGRATGLAAAPAL